MEYTALGFFISFYNSAPLFTLLSIGDVGSRTRSNKYAELRALSIYVASPATSPSNSATLIYVTTIASWRRAFH